MSDWNLKRVMRWSVGIVVACGLLVAGSAKAGGDTPFVYPKAKKVEQVDDYHGTKVADPYRGLEDPDTPESKAWIEAENKITFGYLEQIPARGRIKERLTAMWDYVRYSAPYKRGGHYFLTRNDGLQNQSPLYTLTTLNDEPKLLLDPNKLTDDGTVSLAGYDITEDGKFMAYGLAASGSDWNEWKVRDVETGKDLDDLVKWVKFSGASWTHDGKGFFYSRYDEPKEDTKLEDVNYFQKLFYHRVGTPQAEDQLIYDRKDQKEWGFGGSVTDDGRYLVINVWKGTERKNLIFYKDLQVPNALVVELIKEFEAEFDLIDHDGAVVLLKTDLDAPRSRVIAIDTTKPERGQWKEIIPQTTETLRQVSAVGQKFAATYLKDAYTQVKIFELDGKPVRELKFPALGTAGGFGGRRNDAETFYMFTGFTYPATIYRYDMATGESTIFKKPKVDINPDEFETKQVFYKSKDGAKVPMFITHKKGIKLDGGNPTYL